MGRNGLSINEKEFTELSIQHQLAVLYTNTEVLKSMVRRYEVNQRIQYAWLIVLTITVGAGKYLGVI